jgi:hypothetical protein
MPVSRLSVASVTSRRRALLCAATVGSMAFFAAPGAQAQTLGGTCSTWGEAKGKMVCAQVTKGKLQWVQPQPDTAAAAPSTTAKAGSKFSEVKVIEKCKAQGPFTVMMVEVKNAGSTRFSYTVLAGLFDAKGVKIGDAAGTTLSLDAGATARLEVRGVVTGSGKVARCDVVDLLKTPA